MNKAFCDCGRDHKWPDDPPGCTVSRLCRCKRVLEPQTDTEYAENKRQHQAAIDAISRALQPTPCLFSSDRRDNDGCIFGKGKY